jgi:hypothetical protein
MKISIVSFFLLLLAASCDGQSKYRKAADEIAANAPSAKNMNVGKDNYSLYIPAGWDTARQRAYGVDYYFIFAPKTQDDPNTNINVQTEYMQNLSLEEYRRLTIKSVEKGIPSSVMLAQGDITANGLKGAWYSYSLGPQDIEATLVSYIFPKNGVAYIITAGTQTKDAARYRSLFDSVAKSLKFTD